MHTLGALRIATSAKVACAHWHITCSHSRACRTSFEFWLSMQSATANGLGGAATSQHHSRGSQWSPPLSGRSLVSPSKKPASRCLTHPVHNADYAMVTQLLMLWDGKSAADARAVLARPDITVTNQKDKDIHLDKLITLHEDTRIAWAKHAQWANQQHHAIV